VSLPVAEMFLRDVAARFGAKVRAGKFRTRCPAHKDRLPSLSGTLNENGDRVLIHCFAGCDPEEITEAVGLKMADLFVRRGRGQPESPLRAARVSRPDRRQWAKDVLASKLPAFVADVLADPEARRLFPAAGSDDDLRRSLYRLATSLGFKSRKVAFRCGWRWERPPNREGDTVQATEAAKPQETAEADTSLGGSNGDVGQKRPFAALRRVQETGEGDSHSPVRYEVRRSRSVQHSFPAERRATTDGNDGAVCRGCSECGDAGVAGLYGLVRPGYWLCSRCWWSRGGWGGKPVCA